jgi:hypothetical protein
VNHPHLDRLLAELDAPIRRVVFARGVEATRDTVVPGSAWHTPHVSSAAPTPARATPRSGSVP